MKVGLLYPFFDHEGAFGEQNQHTEDGEVERKKEPGPLVTLESC